MMASSSGPDEAQKFHDELHWCISQLELGLQRQDPDSRQAVETMKILKILRSPKAPLVKKRQAMRNALGDYRKKMKESEKKFLAGLRHSKFQTQGNTKKHSKSKFLRQSHSRTVDRDDLGSHLSNLHLQPSHGLGDSGGGSGSRSHRQDILVGNPTAGFYSQQNNSDLSNIESSDSVYATQVSDDRASPSAGGQTLIMGSARQSEVSSGQAHVKFENNSNANVQVFPPSTTSEPSDSGDAFHFVSSDNSFCFRFSNDDENADDDNEKDERRGDCVEKIETTCEDFSHSKLNVNGGNDKVKPNVFEYKRADNSFVFNFS